MPRSPCMASTGCKNRAGVPVLFKVATIFLATIPALPIPVKITRPLELIDGLNGLFKFRTQFGNEI